MKNHFRVLTISWVFLPWFRISNGYDNLSTGRGSHTWMSSLFSTLSPAGLAVDGYINKTSFTELSCSMSANNQPEATWRIDLGDVRSIKSVQIYYRNENLSDWDNTYRGRFAGFFLYVSNTTSKEDGFLCYHELQNGTNSPPPILTVPCISHAQYIIYYNERNSGTTYPSYYSLNAFVELCCRQIGMYGNNCNMTCPTNCQERRCSIDIGTCLGCENGYTGIKCDTSCSNHHYGQECKNTCGNCLNEVPCQHVNGSCLNGCSAGWRLAKCVTPCELGRYGVHCQGICNKNCVISGVCNHVTGTCVGGCKAGFQGKKCDRECDAGKYGEDCRLKCGKCKNERACNHVTGECFNGCSAGYLTAFCNKSCEPGYHGEDCVQKCSGHCANDLPCNVVNGYCDNGCNSEWQGDKCDKERCDSKFVTGMLCGVGIETALILLGVTGFLFGRRYRKTRTNKRKPETKATVKRQTATVNEVLSMGKKTSTDDDYQSIADIPNDVNQYDTLQSNTPSTSKQNIADIIEYANP